MSTHTFSLPWRDSPPPRSAAPCWRLSGGVAWTAGAAALFVVIGAVTWKQWTVPAFPLDAGREMVVPKLILEGRALYTDIRCFYGPLGYWLNAAMAAGFGAGPQGLWWVNLIRFGLTIGLLWLLARRLLSPAMAALALSSGVYGLFFSLAVPYSAAVGWGALLLTAGILCGARLLGAAAFVSADGDDLQEDTRPCSRWWSIASAGLLSLAATTKQEYAVSSALVLLILILDQAWRASTKNTRRSAVMGMAAAAIIPFGVVAAMVLSSVPPAVLLRDNLWIPELMDYCGGALTYCLGYMLKPLKLTAMVESAGLLVAAIALMSLLGESRRAEPTRSAPGRSPRTLWVILLVALVVAGAAECWSRGLVRSRWGIFDYPKPRLRELIETAPILCLPLSLAGLIVLARRGWRQGPKQVWLRLGPRYRLGILCALSYLAFITREVPGADELNRQPFSPVLLVWLLAVVVPQWLGWRRLTCRIWTAGVGLLLLAGTACGLDNIVFYQTRTATVLPGRGDVMYAWQRRRPFTPQWFHDALQTVRAHQHRIAGRSIACVPEGAWVNVLLDLDWPTRDTQWLTYFEPWIVEDLTRSPPAFLLVMEPLDEAGLAQVNAIVQRCYVPIETNASDMTLYEYRESENLREAVPATGR